MNETAAALARFVAGLLRVVAVMLIAYGGTCACVMATSKRGDEFVPNNGWQQVAVCLPVGLALWLAASWLGRRAGPRDRAKSQT